VDEALEIGAKCLVVVSGGLLQGSKSLPFSHEAIRNGLALLLDYARPLGMPIAIEPLHPMYAADRCAINTLGHALELCDGLGPGIGVAIDAYHLWWDRNLAQDIEKAGKQQLITAYHVCDWLVPTQHLLLDRGLMGEGVIDLKNLSQMVGGAGYSGFVEVEIFSERLWSKPPERIVQEVMDAFVNHC
jgi:sugar phosphate isomerase/epimerase